MIQPLAPFVLSGFLWYQGESNCFLKETDSYTRKMRVLIDNWRQTWNDKSLPFYFVQIAPFYYSRSKDEVIKSEETLPEFREAQTAALQVSNTAMIVTTDLVDDVEDIHPSYKWEVGNRLALVALNKHYGRKKIVSSGPVFKEMKKAGNILKLKFTETGSGLKSRDGNPLTWFSISGADGKFVTASAVIKGNQVWVSAAGISSPVHVRFGWNEAAQPNLVNKEGLPARPFRTDNSIQPYNKL
jgi:sialate O-acetylesterase